jgi:CubicO group peptidase (beta-lactamase class C family)
MGLHEEDVNRNQARGVPMRVLPILALLAGSVLGAAVAAADVAPAVQELRRHMLDADVNSLTFRSMDQLFDTRRVENAGPVWELPRAEHELDFSYTFRGQTRPAADALERTYTNALVILKKGSIVAEIYRNNTTADSHFISFSMSKSITSMLIGQAIADGHLRSVDDQIVSYLPELKDTAYDGVTIRQALMMRSGANWEERYDFGRPGLAAAAFEESLVTGRFRYASFAKMLERIHPPGEHFNYSTVETGVLGWVLERATKRTITEYTTERLWKPTGMESYGYWILDGAPEEGREFNGAGFNATARDYARLGLLMLRNGKAARAQVLPEAWVRESTQPTHPGPVDMPLVENQLGYQYQWWTLVGTQAYMALGLQGQHIFVDPATETVVVKLSYFPIDNVDVQLETFDFLRAVSAWEPR